MDHAVRRIRSRQAGHAGHVDIEQCAATDQQQASLQRRVSHIHQRRGKLRYFALTDSVTPRQQNGERSLIGQFLEQ